MSAAEQAQELAAKVEHLSSRLTLEPTPAEMQEASDLILALASRATRLEEALREIEAKTHLFVDWWGCEPSAEDVNTIARSALEGQRP